MVGAVVQQARDPGYRDLLDLTELWHRAWAARHNLAYVRVDGPVAPTMWPGYWDQPALIANLLETYEEIFWLDADALVKDQMANPREGIADGWLRMTRHPGPPEHWNCGVLFARNTPLMRRFFLRVLEYGPGEPPWYQQAVMNHLLSKRPWRGLISNLDHRWNSTFGVSEVYNASIVAWHNGGAPEVKFELMRKHGEGLHGWVQITGNV